MGINGANPASFHRNDQVIGMISELTTRIYCDFSFT